MRPYEVMVIFDADLEEETIRSAVERWLAAHRVEGRRARPRRLVGQAPARLRDQAPLEGYYVVLQARAEPAAMDELHRTLSLADEVIRHKVLRIPEKVYGPPKAAGAPRRGADAIGR